MLIREAGVRPAPNCCGVAVMAGASEPGETRLALVPPLDHDQAAALNTAVLTDIAENLSLAAKRAPISGYMAYGKAGMAPFFKGFLPPQMGLMEIELEDFGECLLCATEHLFSAGHRAACVLSADSPTLPTEFLIEAQRVLDQPGRRIVVGPATNGGCYLLGMNELHRELFLDVSWRTEHAARQIKEQADALGLEVVLLPDWYGVDDVSGLLMLAQETLDGAGYAKGSLSHVARNSSALMRHFKFATDRVEVGPPSPGA